VSDPNYSSAGRLFATEHPFPELYPGFFRPTIIMEREILIARRSTFSDEELEMGRNEQDSDQRGIYAKLLSKNSGPGAVPSDKEESFHTLAQPEFDSPRLSVKSMRALINIRSGVAMGRRATSGREPLDRLYTGRVPLRMRRRLGMEHVAPHSVHGDLRPDMGAGQYLRDPRLVCLTSHVPLVSQFGASCI
jgi:hypothetical protein